MATTLYARMAQIALRLIKEKGAKAVWTKTKSGVLVDAQKPWLGYSAETLVNYDVSIVVLPYDSIEKNTVYPLRDPLESERVLSPSGNVTAEHIRFVMGVSTFEVAIGDIFKINNKVYKVKTFDPIAPGGSIVVYRGVAVL